ncbi:MAG: hypothetical protein J1F64_07815, partial [Oscillospiraceae bacterium]|nr:hypothetical protein [Oscillospiraceae bacterium]
MEFKRKASAIIAAVLAANMCLTGVFAEPETEVDKGAELSGINTAAMSPAGVVFPVPDSFSKVSENDKYILYADYNTGEIAVNVKESGYNWFSNPRDRDEDVISGGEIKMRLSSQLVVYYTQGYSSSVVTSQSDCVNRKKLKYEKVDDGIKFIYEFATAGYTVPVKYTLNENGLKAELLITEITPEVVTRQETVNGSKDKMDVDYNITKIDFLPFFGAAGMNETGYMLIPEGSGGVINLNNGKVNSIAYSAPVYGQYKDIESMSDLSNNLVRMPVYGMKRGDNAFFTIIEENESISIINAAVAGSTTAFNTVYPTVQDKIIDFSVGENRTQPLSESLADGNDFSMQYYFLSDDKANYSAMAEVYRNYLIDNKGFEKKESADRNPLYIETYSGVERKTSIFGIVRRVFEPLTTFSDTEKMIERYNGEGITDIAVKYNGWTKSSKRKKVKTSPDFEKSIGGKSGFMKLIRNTQNTGASIYPSINFAEYSKSGSGFSPVFNAAKAPNQSPAYQKKSLAQESMLGRRWSLLKPDQVESVADKFASKYKNLGIDTVAVDYIGEMLYSDNTKGGTKRGRTVHIWENILSDYESEIGGIMITNANAYAIPSAEMIADAPANEYGNELTDENVPFYQMVIHGMVSYSAPSINLSSDWENSVLKAVETGSGLKYTLMSRNTDILKDKTCKVILTPHT